MVHKYHGGGQSGGQFAHQNNGMASGSESKHTYTETSGSQSGAVYGQGSGYSGSRYGQGSSTNVARFGQDGSAGHVTNGVNGVRREWNRTTYYDEHGNVISQTETSTEYNKLGHEGEAGSSFNRYVFIFIKKYSFD